MGNLVDYAKNELKRIGMIDSGEPYNDLATKAILDLIELFASQGHSGFSAPYGASMFHRLAMFKPASPLTGEDDEWNEVGPGVFQNKRCSSVFKNGKDGIAYNIEGKVFTDDGEVWYTCKDSKVNVTFPYVVPDKPEHVYRNKEDIQKMGDTIIENDVNSFVDAVLYKLRKKMCETGDPSELNAYGESFSIIQHTFDEVFPAPIDVESDKEE